MSYADGVCADGRDWGKDAVTAGRAMEKSVSLLDVSVHDNTRRCQTLSRRVGWRDGANPGRHVARSSTRQGCCQSPADAVAVGRGGRNGRVYVTGDIGATVAISENTPRSGTLDTKRRFSMMRRPRNCTDVARGRMQRAHGCRGSCGAGWHGRVIELDVVEHDVHRPETLPSRNSVAVLVRSHWSAGEGRTERSLARHHEPFDHGVVGPPTLVF